MNFDIFISFASSQGRRTPHVRIGQLEEVLINGHPVVVKGRCLQDNTGRSNQYSQSEDPEEQTI